jgi:hypothetical protein
MIYDPKTRDIGVAKYAAQTYILGASVHVGLRILNIKRWAVNLQRDHPEYVEKRIGEIVAPDVDDARQLARFYEDNIDNVARAAKYQIEAELHKEIEAGRYRINTPELRERSSELTEIFLGGEEALNGTRSSLVKIIAGADEFLSEIGRR